MDYKKGEGYNFKTENKLQPMGDSLKAVHEIEADLTDSEDVEAMIKYLEDLDGDKDLKAIQQSKRPKMSIQDKVAMAMKDPAGTYIIKDGKRISLSQYMKNSKSMNNRNNFNFQDKKDARFEDGKQVGPNNTSGDYNSMVFNTKKVK
jgi:hypothetical protein